VKRINLRLLLLLVGGTLAMLVAVFFLRRFQVTRNAGSLVTLARQRLADGKFIDALATYKRYVGLRPDDAAVFAEYAELLLELAESPSATRADIARAYTSLETAIRGNPDNAKLRARVVEFDLRVGRFTDAREHLLVLSERAARKSVSDTSTTGSTNSPDKPAATKRLDPDDAVGLKLMLARSHLGTGDIQKAADLLAELIDFDPTTDRFRDEPRTQHPPSDAYVILAAIYQERFEKPAAAKTILERLVQDNGGDAAAWLAMSRWHRQRGDMKAALAAVRKALELAPQDAETLFAAYEVAVAAQDFSQAEAVATKVGELFPNDERSYRARASLALQRGQPAEAEQVLRDGVAQLPGKASLLLMLAECLMQQNKLDDVDLTLNRLRDVYGTSSPVLGLFEARLLLARQRWLQAKQKLEEIRPLSVGMDDIVRQIDLFLAQCHEQLGEFDAQLEVNRRVLAANPDSLAARVGAATALAASGKWAQGLADLEVVAAALPPERLASVPQIWQPLLQLRTMAQLQRPAPDRDWSQVDGLVELVQKHAGYTATQQALLRADVLERKGETEAAIGLLEKTVAAEPQAGAAWLELVTLTLRHSGADAARKVLARMPAEVAGNPGTLIFEVQLAAREGGEAMRTAFPQIEKRTATIPEAARSRVLSTLASILFATGDLAESERLWRQVGSLDPDDMRPRLAIFEIASQQGDVDKARQAAAEVERAAGPRNPQTKVTDAGVRVLAVKKALAARGTKDGQRPQLDAEDRRKLDDARNLLIEAENDRPGWSLIQMLFAEVEGLKGNIPAVIDRLKKAIAIGPANPALVRQLVTLLYGSNRIEEAQQALAALGPDGLGGMERISAEMELRSGNLDDAVAVAERGVAKDSRNADDLIWLGQLLDRAGKPDRAGQMLERAVEVAPERPEPWLALFMHQVATGKRRSAEQTLDRAAARLSGARKPLALAQGYEMLGRVDDAERQYRAGLEEFANDTNLPRGLATLLLRAGRLAPAEEILRKTIDAPAENPETSGLKVWARRTLAELLAERGTYREFQDALALLRKNTGDNGATSPEDVAIQIRLLAARPEPASWRQALALFKTLEKSQALSTAQRLERAQLLDKTGRWEDCRDELTSIVASPNTPPAFVALLVEKLIDHGELTAARTWMRRLAATQAEAAPTLALEARLCIAEKNRDAAVTAARKLMPDASSPQGQADTLPVVARLMEDLGFFKAADKVLTQFADASPDGLLARALFLGRQQQPEEALDLLEKSWNRVALERLMHTAVEIVRAQPSPAEFAPRLEPWITKARRQDPESVILALLAADLLDLQGRAGETEAMYRELLARKDLTPMQRAIVTNNLAYHLARPETAAEAGTLIEKALAELGPHPDLLDTRGLIHLAAGRSREALQDLEEAALQPSDTKLLHLASAQAAIGDREAAKKSLQAARRKGLAATKLAPADRQRLDQLEAALGGQPEA
jgi:tetratricopeptide (TPR) repeat protein